MLKLIILLFISFLTSLVNAQSIGINEDGRTPDPSAILDIHSQNKGMLLPRLTTGQRDAITDPAEGLMIYNLDSKCLNYFNGIEWKDACADLNCYPQPSPADAGKDTVVRAFSVQLQANTPYEGTGEWSIYSGGSGSFSDIADPASFFSGTEGTYELRWTVSTACGYRTDIVKVTLLEPCPASVTDIESNIYPVVQIGNQCWIAANLNTATYNDGTPIPNLTGQTDWNNATTGAWCYYNNDPANAYRYGKLYNFYAIETGKLCPSGWRVPTLEDFERLRSNFDQNMAYVYALKSTDLWTLPNDGNNATGLTLVPNGWRTSSFDAMGTRMNMHLNKSYSVSISYYTNIYINNGYIANPTTAAKNYGMSCRCIKE